MFVSIPNYSPPHTIVSSHFLFFYIDKYASIFTNALKNIYVSFDLQINTQYREESDGSYYFTELKYMYYLYVKSAIHYLNSNT